MRKHALMHGKLLTSMAFTSVLWAQAAQGSEVDPDDFRFQVHTSLWTTHFNPKPEHNNTQNLIGFEWYGDSFSPQYLEPFHDYMGNARPFIGGAWFRNSFDQKSIYLYGGIRQELLAYAVGQREVQTYAKVTAGVIHGYRGEFRDKIPFNQFGIAPAVIPMIGAQYRNAAAELTFFGFSGVMLTVGYTF